MSHRAAAFAIPGEITTLTGGYIYERRLLLGLREIGHDVQHVQLVASFPDPSATDMAQAGAALTALDPGRALILDGLVFGAIDTDLLAQVQAPIVAMIHHPLAHETGLTPGRRDHLFRTERANLALADAILVPSPHTARILVTEYGAAEERITVAPPGTDQPQGTRSPVTPPLILSVGLQHPRKGHDVLLSALAKLTDLPWQAVIVGRAHDPAHADDLSRLCVMLDLESRVHIVGEVERDRLQALYGQATIFALATRYEGYGIVFDEALSWGLPIVSCRTGAVPETIPPSAGFLVPPDDTAAFAEALGSLLTDGAARVAMAEAAGRAGRALPGWHDTAHIASTVLDSLAR